MSATIADPRTTVLLATAGASDTAWIEVVYPVDAAPTEMLRELALFGFIDRFDMGLHPFPATSTDPVTGRTTFLHYNLAEVHLSKRGTGLFSSWTDAEEREYLALAHEILARHGHTDVPLVRRTPEEMI